MKRILILAAFSGAIALKAQTGNSGINTTDPKATLDVNLSKDYKSGQLAGIAVPQLTGDQIEAIAPATSIKSGTLVYATAVSTAATKDITGVGYWYWKDATDKWEPIIIGTSIGGNTNGGTGWNLDGNAATTAANYVGTKDAQPLNFKTNATADPNPKMTITSDGNVGVGTTAPSQKLDVNGTAAVGYLQVKSQDGAYEGGEINLFGAGTHANVHMDNVGGNWRIFDSKTLTPRIFANMATGNVGIGTTAPESTLDVRGVVTASVFGARSPQDNQTHDMWFGATNTIGDGKYWGHIGGNTDTTDNIRRLAFYSNTNYFTGNVGLGTTAPTQKLDVYGNAILNYLYVRPQNTVDEGGEIQLQGSAANPAIQIDNFAGYARVFGQKGMQVHSGLAVFSLPDGTGDQNVLTADASGNLNKIASANYISSMSEPWQVSGGTTKATANNQNIYQTGSVGIGTSAIPAYKLDVNGDVIAGWHRSRGTTGWYNETYNGGWHMADNVWVRSYAGKNVWTDGVLGSQNGLSVGYGGGAPNTTGGAIIAGHVGIGTTTPGTKLDVAGTGRFSDQTQISIGTDPCCNNNYTLSLAENTAGNGRQAKIQFHNAGAAEGYIALNKDGNRRMIFNDNQGAGMGIEVNGDAIVTGKVGIGTATPQVNLDVKAKTTTGPTVEGILIPQVNKQKAQDMGANAPEGTLVYISDVSAGSGIYVDGTVTATGFYYMQKTGATTKKWVAFVDKRVNLLSAGIDANTLIYTVHGF